MKKEQIKSKILDAIAAAEKKGYVIVAEDWGNTKMKCSCPLGCINLSNGTKPEDSFDGGVRSVLEVDDNWLQSFIDGFDGNGHAEGAQYAEAWSLGKEIRVETKAIDYADFVNDMDEENEQGEK